MRKFLINLTITFSALPVFASPHFDAIHEVHWTLIDTDRTGQYAPKCHQDIVTVSQDEPAYSSSTFSETVIESHSMSFLKIDSWTQDRRRTHRGFLIRRNARLDRIESLIRLDQRKYIQKFEDEILTLRIENFGYANRMKYVLKIDNNNETLTLSESRRMDDLPRANNYDSICTYERTSAEIFLERKEKELAAAQERLDSAEDNVNRNLEDATSLNDRAKSLRKKANAARELVESEE